MRDPAFAGLPEVAHHALHIAGDDAVARKVAGAFAEFDTVHIALSSLGIDESREIRTLSHEGPSRGDRRYIIVSFDRATLEAQNALLKTLEDPPRTTRLVLVSPDFAGLIDTVRSRLHAIDLPEAAFAKSGLLPLSTADRLAAAAPAVESKNFGALRAMVTAIIPEVSALPAADQTEARSLINAALTELSGRSPSPKMLMEYLMVRLPKVGALRK